MASRVGPLDAPITIELDDKALPARAGEPLAAAIIAAGQTVFSRSAKYHRPRGAFCLSGGCGNCLMKVDGVPNVATCQTHAKPGMRLERQNAFPDARFDLLQANDVVFRSWFNHHEFLAGVPVVEKIVLEVARKLSGLGELPRHAGTPRQPAALERLGVVIVGGGASGLAAARKLSERGVQYTLFERDDELGGRLTTGADSGTPPVFAPPADRVRTGARVVGLFADDGPRFLAVVQHGRLHLVYFEQLILAHGSQPTLTPFENNDLPGIYAGRAVSRLLRRQGVLVGQRVAVVGDAEEARALAARLKEAGAEPVAVGAEPVKAHGLNAVTRLTVKHQGKEEDVACDAVALCTLPTPATELARAGGAAVSWHVHAKVFAVDADQHGQTRVPGLYVCGELRGPMSPSASAESGLLAAESVVRALTSGGVVSPPRPGNPP
jgi:sarcosine oxidase subunit alpha